jgi:hypothetical protein
MNDFGLLLIIEEKKDDEEKDAKLHILEYRCDNKTGLNLIHKWLNFMFKSCNMRGTKKLRDLRKKLINYNKRLKERAKNLMILREPVSLKDFKYENRISANDIINAFSSRSIISKHSRTGVVYKITINEDHYALKIPKKDRDDLVYELENEARIYKRLAYMYII